MFGVAVVRVAFGECPDSGESGDFPVERREIDTKSVQACGGFGRPLFTRVGSRPSFGALFERYRIGTES